MEEDLLGDLISAADSLNNENKPFNTAKCVSVIKEVNIFDKEESEVKNVVTSTSKINDSCSVLHTGLSDSSDDEDNKYFQEAKYNEYGKDIKRLLGAKDEQLKPNNANSTWTSKANISNTTKQLSLPPSTDLISKNSFIDPIFGIRIINPLVSGNALQERMVGRESVSLAKLKWYIQKLTPDKDWVIGGVVIQKSASKTSQKGSQFCIWSLSDLHGDLKTVSVFLFGKAYQGLWKTVVGTVVGILNPNIFDSKGGSKDEACLSIDNHQKVMILGQSKDLGTCKSTKKSGEKCTAFVNTSQSEHCIYHIKQEYQKYSKRADMQNPFASRGLTALRNKVLGKNEVFYAGKLYTAIPAMKSKKLTTKDEGRLKALKNNVNTNTNQGINTNNLGVHKKMASRVELSKNQRAKDLALLRKLGANSELNICLDKKSEFSASVSQEVSLAESKTTALNVINKLKERQSENKVADGDNMLNFDKNGTLDVANEKEFDGKLSEEVGLGESKKLAVDTVNKLKMRNGSAKDNQNKLDKQNISDGSSLPVGTNSGLKSVIKPSVSQGNSKETALNPNLSNPSVRNDRNKSLPFLNSPLAVPSLCNNGQTLIDLNSPVSRKLINNAKLNALKYVQKNGQIKKSNPMSTKGAGRKRNLDDANLVDKTDPKKQKIQENEFFSERFKKMMSAKSSHTDLIEQHDDEEKEKYFKNLEIKEKMEEKMANTFKVDCKAVRCLQCKYTNFSASEKCKAEKHPLRVFDAFKRFFKCGNCENRTVCLEVVPTVACKNCGSGKWERASMMKEKNVKGLHSLSIRGGEQKFSNSTVTNGNLDLLVPTD